MIIWTDAQLSPALAAWLQSTFPVEAKPVRALGLRDAEDRMIFEAARAANAVVMTKDRDFADLLAHFGPPPQVIWLTCGNTSNAVLRTLLINTWPRVAELLRSGEPLIEVSEAPSHGS